MPWTRSTLLTACLAFAAAFLPAAAARSDKVTVKGTVLEGTVVSAGAGSVEMETVYGAGKLSLKMDDVTSIESDGVLHVYHDDAETTGKRIAVEKERLVIDGQAVPRASVHAITNEIPGERSLLDRIDLALPFWSGNLDLAFDYRDAPIDTLSLATGFELRRVKAPTRLRFGSSYRRATSQEEGEQEDTLANEIRGWARYEHDLAPRVFAFGAVDAEYDEVERVSIRAVPKVGLGYKFFDRPAKAYFSVDAGLAYVYERFFGGDTNQYPGLGLGAEAFYALAFGGQWRARVDYTPSFEDFVDDYLLRAETSLLFPLTDHLGLKASVVDLYDSTPAEGLERNDFQTLLGISVLF